MRFRWLRYTYQACIVICYLGLSFLLWRIQRYSASDYRVAGSGPDVQAQLNWVSQMIHRGDLNTQSWYPEGYFFEHVLYGLTLVNQAVLNPTDTALARRNAQEIEWALQQLESSAGHAPFPRAQAVEYGVFYMGWLNRLVGGLLLIQPEAERDPARVAQFHQHTRQLAEALTASPTLHLEAYPGLCWPVDNVVALSSLRLHDALYDTQYGALVDQWLTYTQAHLDPNTGLLPHHIDADTGTILIGARGSSLVMALTFLPELDPAFAQDQYQRFRERYAEGVLDFVLIREYPQGTTGPDDVDSGPVVNGWSPIASGVSLATARANGDAEIFERMVQLSELLGGPLTINGDKRFSLGLLPIGDIFLVWGKTTVHWTKPEPQTITTYPRLTPQGHWWSYGIALSIGLGVWLPVGLVRGAHRKK